jgi:Domain of unknown function (DUF4124)
MTRLLFSLLVLGILIPGPALAAQKQAKGNKTTPTTMFKCKDAQGRTYYADKPGPECASGVTELSKQGVRVNRPGSTQAQAGTQAKPERTRRDKALLSTYSTEEQIESAKQRNLELPQQAVKQMESKLDKVRKDLQGLQMQAESYASQKKQIPAAVLDDVKAKQGQVARLEEELATKRGNVAEISQRFDADKQRFRELTGVQASR